jgi:predicted nucleic-acid-binding protein
METFDTNVVLRTIYSDDAAQADRATRAWKTAIAGSGVFLTTTVLVELAWVLRGAVKLPRESIVAALKRLCDIEGVTVEDAPRVRRALDRFEQGPAGFADYLILESAHDASALPVVTFDDRFARSTDVRLLPPEDR